MAEPEVLLNGLGIPESPRWHEGRLWFCNWIDRQVVAVGRLLTTGDKVQRHERDGSVVTLADQHANEIVVDHGRGNIYINGADFDFAGGGAPEPGYIKLITAGGALRQVADDIQFPNGMVITPDNRTLIISESFARRLTAFDIGPDGGLSNRRMFAGDVAPDGITLDAEGAVWVQTGFSVARVAEGGQVLQRVDVPEGRAPFALMLGGPDRRTLFILTAEWRLTDDHVVNLARLANGPRTGEILALPVEVPGAGRP
jgi:sugar lactone lactonase YvrE